MVKHLYRLYYVRLTIATRNCPTFIVLIFPHPADYDNLWDQLSCEAASKISSSDTHQGSGSPFLGIQIEIVGVPEEVGVP